MPTHRSKKRRSPKRRRQILFARLVFAACCVLLAALLVWGVKAVLGGHEHKPQSSAQSQTAESQNAASLSEAEQLAQQTQTQEAQWSQNGKDFMAWLGAQSGFEKLDLTVQENYPYLICVNRAASCVTVYTDDGTGQYTQPYAAMVCSGGSDTPTGIFNTPVQYP